MCVYHTVNNIIEREACNSAVFASNGRNGWGECCSSKGDRLHPQESAGTHLRPRIPRIPASSDEIIAQDEAGLSRQYIQRAASAIDQLAPVVATLTHWIRRATRCCASTHSPAQHGWHSRPARHVEQQGYRVSECCERSGTGAVGERTHPKAQWVHASAGKFSVCDRRCQPGDA